MFETMPKNKRVRISNESVNCYGTRILTSGIDLTQYQRNPVLLYMHNRGTVVGLVRDVRVEGQDVTGELVFDEATDLSCQLKKQWEFGSVKMVSANFQIQEVSDDESLVLEGQSRATVTRSKLIEVSVVDIGGNDDAIVLSHAGKTLPLALGSDDVSLPLLNKAINNPFKKEKDMDLKTIALSLGLSETATEADVNAEIASLKLERGHARDLAKQVTDLKAVQEQIMLSTITGIVDAAIQEKRIPATMKDHFINLGKQMGADSLKLTISAMQPQVKLSQSIHRTDETPAGENDYSKFVKLSQVPTNMMEELVDNHRDEYARLYKAEYGFDL